MRSRLVAGEGRIATGGEWRILGGASSEFFVLYEGGFLTALAKTNNSFSAIDLDLSSFIQCFISGMELR